MMSTVQAVFFDVDGVLVDSLPAHLDYCRVKAEQFELNLAVPTTERFRLLVQRGARVSPMSCFFETLGFPPSLIDRAVADYQIEFATNYKPKLFPGIEDMLETLVAKRMQLGIVSSNVRANVLPALGRAIRFFDVRCLYFFDINAPTAKGAQLIAAAQNLNVAADMCAYVGDQPADELAAREAGMRFVGVTYGWGFAARSRGDMAQIPDEIPNKLIYCEGRQLRMQGVDNGGRS